MDDQINELSANLQKLKDDIKLAESGTSNLILPTPA